MSRRGPYLRHMIAQLLRRLSEPEPRPLEGTDQRTALAALLVRIANSDGHYAPEEAARIDRILASRYGLSDAEAAETRAHAEELERGAPDTVRFTRAVKDTVPYEERLGVVEALWQVVLADGVRDPEEDAQLRLVASLLGVTDQDSALARQRATPGA